MNMMDHYPTKKRRLMLNSKTPTRTGKSDSTHITNSQFEAPKVSEISLPKKKQNKHNSPGNSGNTSTDDSTVEIGWDNNSPKTSQVLKQKRTGRTRKATKNNLSTLIKQIPKTRKSHESETAGVLNSTSFVGTWMQQSLAARPTRRPVPTQRQNLKRPRASLSTRRNSTIRGSKVEALDFNEEIKRFLNHAPNLNNSKRNSPIHLRSSPGVMTRSQAASPSYFSNSSADSLFEDSLLTGIDSQLPSKTPVRSCRTSSRTPARMRFSTPRVTRSARKQAHRPVPAFDTIHDKDTNERTPLSDRNSNKKDSKDIEIHEDGKPTKENKTKHKVKQKKESTDFFDNEELDELLSTQPDILPPNKNFTNIKRTNIAGPNTEKKKETCVRKNTSTPVPDKLSVNAPKVSKTPELFGDDFVDDDIFANFDMSEIRCKSQDTPPNGCFARLSEDQRKLKSKCYTSPLPLNNNQRLKLDKAKTFVPISEAVPSSKQLDADMKTLTIKSPIAYKKTIFTPHVEVDVKPREEPYNTLNNNNNNNKHGIPVSTILENSQKSFLRNSMVTTACRKPFVPPKKQNAAAHASYSSSPSNSAQCPIAYKMAFELSAIQGTTSCGGGRNQSMDISLSSIPQRINNQSFNPFSSTQKCTMEEINEKRKFAQIKLRERLRRKRK